MPLGQPRTISMWIPEGSVSRHNHSTDLQHQLRRYSCEGKIKGQLWDKGKISGALPNCKKASETPPQTRAREAQGERKWICLKRIDWNNIFANLEFEIRRWEFHRVPNLLLAEGFGVFLLGWLVFWRCVFGFISLNETEKYRLHSGQMYADVYFNSIKSTTVPEVPKYRKADWNLTTGLKIRSLFFSWSTYSFYLYIYL